MTVGSGLGGLVRALGDAEIEFILVGGMAAVLHGVPVVTEDLDIVHRRTGENIDRILTLLHKQEAVFRGQPAGRRLVPTVEHLSGTGHLNLMTRLGPLDLLCELREGLGYDALWPDTEIFEGDDIRLRVLKLPRLIEIKTETGRPKDRLMLPLLLAALKKKI